MVLASILHSQLLFPVPINLFNNDLVLMLVGAISAFLLAYLFTFGVIAICRKFGWLDQPEARRVHKKPVPRLGGVGMFLAFVIASLVFYISDSELRPKESTIYWLLLASATLIVCVHAYDDVKGLKPLPKLLAQTLAVIVIMGPSFVNMQFRGVLLFGFSNPFGARVDSPTLPWYLKHEITLFIHNNPATGYPDITWLAIPAVLFTWFWMVGMMNTVNWIDGMDGLATGVVGITGLFITIISWILNQHTIATLSAIFTGAVLGFLPHNWNPAKIFMGDSGSQFLGLGLAVLSIMGGAKVALALMVLGIPILDVAIVIINRVRRGQSPLHYDKTHLHHRFMATGLSVRQICYVLYGLMILFGILALSMPPIYKLVGMSLVGLTMAGLIIWLDYRQRQRGTPIRLDGSEPTPLPAGGVEEPAEQEPPAPPTDTDEGNGVAQATATPPPPGSTAGHLHVQLPL